MTNIVFRFGLILILLAMIPPMLIMRARYSRSTKTRVHIIQDMDNQPKFRAQHAAPMFADGRAMRPDVPGTVSRGHLEEDDHLYRGLNEAGVWATTFPDEVPMSSATLQRGRERYNIYCLPCHGASGDGNGVVSIRAMRLMERGDATWVQPATLYAPQVRDRETGHLFNTITNGLATMPSYGSQIPTRDRWAIVAYVRAIQRSQAANWTDVPTDEVERLRDKDEDDRAALLEAERAEGNLP